MATGNNGRSTENDDTNDEHDDGGDGGGVGSRGGHGSRYKFFGIKSYLHQFYEDISTIHEEDKRAYEALLQQRREVIRRHRATLWVLILIGGFASMLSGGVMLSIGFNYPEVQTDVGYQEEMRIIDKAAYQFNKRLDQIKVIGLIFFTLGGILVAAALVMSGFIRERDDGQAPLQVQVPEGIGNTGGGHSSETQEQD